MKNGELGLGGLEEEMITQPRTSPFALAKEVKKGKLHRFYLHCAYVMWRLCKLNLFSFLSVVVIVGCGDNHTVLVMKDGRIYSFGSNDYGQLGHHKSRTRAGLLH